MFFTVPRLDALEGPFTFQYIHYPTSNERFIVIPGYGGGRDGPTTPDRPEQEAWMRANSGLRETWYLSWRIDSDAQLQRLLDRIGAPDALRDRS